MDVLYVAAPEALSVPVPSVVPASLNATVPVGVPDMEAVTVAVKVTEPPEKAGLALETSAVDVFCCTVCVSTVEAAARLRPSPP